MTVTYAEHARSDPTTCAGQAPPVERRVKNPRKGTHRPCLEADVEGQVHVRRRIPRNPA